MKKINNFGLLAITILGFMSCEKIIELEVPSSDPILIIESSISNDTTFWTVKLSNSQPYFEQNDKVFIADAFVTISDNMGNVDTLIHQDTGLYATKIVKYCEIGRTYTLKVVHEGKEYLASEKCRPQVSISFLMSFELPDRNGFIEPGFYVFEKAGENETKGDYYLWKIYKNDTLLDDFGYVLDTDEFRETSFFNINIDPDDPLKDMDKNILPRPFPFKFDVGDTAVVEQYNISKAYYSFLVELQSQLSRSGTPFDPPPVNPRTNIQGGAFGFFSVTNLSRASVVVEP